MNGAGRRRPVRGAAVTPDERPAHPTGKALLLLLGAFLVVLLLALVSTVTA